MAGRRILTPSTREALFGLPLDPHSLQQYYLLSGQDLNVIRTRRGDSNQLGMAIHIALLRYPGQGWQEGRPLPEVFVRWLADQIGSRATNLESYGLRDATRFEHKMLAIEYLGLRVFIPEDWKMALTLATHVSFETDDGRLIVSRLMAELKKRRLVLPGEVLLERLALKGRARSRRLAAQSIVDALSDIQKSKLADLLQNDPQLGQSRLVWLRSYPHSTSAKGFHAVLERLKFLRAINLPTDLGQCIHPARLTKFAREGAVAPVHLLNDFGERRRIATLAAQLAELNIMLTDAAIATFERLTGQLFSRSKNKQDQIWSTGKARVGRLMQMFSETIDVMHQAKEHGDDPFKALDLDVGWERLLQSRDEVAAFGELATGDPLSLASERYAQLRKFAPAFLENFAFSVPEAGTDLQAAVALLNNQNRRKKRNLPDIVPMPFAAKHWHSLIYKNGRPNRRLYETAVVSTLRERLRAGDVWVKGSRDYRRFDSYLMPKVEAVPLLQNAGLETDPHRWLKQRHQQLNDRLSGVQNKLRKGQLDGVRLEHGRLKIPPYEAVTPPDAIRLERAIDAVMPRIRITDLLWEVNVKTGFLDAFSDLRSGKNHANPAAVLAAILAGATNLGLERMAYASKDVSHSQLSWANMWYLRPETYSDALGKIVDAHHNLPFSAVWGDAGKTSSDGQFFSSNRNSGATNPKYGPDPGLKIYSFLSGPPSEKLHLY